METTMVNSIYLCYVSLFFFLNSRKTQSDLHTSQSSIQGAEEGAYNAPVLAKSSESSEGKKHFGQRLNKNKRVKPIQENPYSTPEITGRDGRMMEQMR